MKDIAARISELMTSKVGSAPSRRTTQGIADSADKSDDADGVAFEICLAIYREEGLILDHGRVAKAVRRILAKEQKGDEDRADRVAEIHAALMLRDGPAKPENGTGPEGSLKRVAAFLFAPSKDLVTLDPRPIKPEDVCLTCSRTNPTNISFLRYPAKGVPPAIQEQITETQELVGRRLRELGISGDISVSVVIHRGCCRVHGSEERRDGDGVAELPGVLMSVDFGDGVVIQGEHEVRL